MKAVGKTHIVIAAAAVCAAILFAAVRHAGLPAPEEGPGYMLLYPTPEAPLVSTGTFAYGDSLDSVFGKEIGYAELLALAKGLKKAGAGMLQPGDIYAAAFSCAVSSAAGPSAAVPAEECRSRSLKEFALARGEDLYSVSMRANACESAKSSLPVSSVTYVSSGTITSSLWEAMAARNVPPAVIVGFADIFAWKIDFLTEPRNGDRFALIWSERTTALGSPCGLRIAAAAYAGAETGEEYAYSHGASYYGEKGDSFRRAFLRAPLNYRRISSHFSRARFHPILRIYRPHNGIDYAAASGTPVSAVADGVVTYAGRKGGYGNFIELRHGSTYVTGYGHLRGFARGIRSGKSVSQGQVIGYVGKSGLATGPHLDFSIKKNGRFVNFLKLNLPPSRSLGGGELARFQEDIRPLREGLRSAMEGK